MRTKFIILCLALTFFTFNEAKTVFRRTDKISDNFKQLNLPPEEIDPNVAPPEPQKIETIDPDDVSAVSGSDGSAPADEFIEAGDVDESNSAGIAEAVDESANEVDSVPVELEAPNAGPLAVSGSPAAASSSAAASPAVVATTKAPTTAADPSPISKYCKCSDTHCDCCREIGLPLLPIRGPGCAKITYLGNEKMSVSIKYGDITLATRTISSKKSKPICLGLPGGYSQFCGRVYGLSKAKENFKACLGFELRADDEVEAALRVSCFKFGPEGLRVAEAEPLPSEVVKEEEDDDDIFGFGGGDDADDYEEEEEEDEDYGDDPDDEEDAEDPAPPEDADYGGFSLAALLDELDGDDEDETPAKPAAVIPAVTATRNVGVRQKDLMQGKDDKGGSEDEAAGDEGSSAVAVESLEEAAAAVVTPTPATAVDVATTVKSKRSKKAKKNKKKKNAATSETDFAYEIINGILDFFN